MPRILNYDIIGCYAQTELGHGSNVRGLETTARWDPVKKEFEIHSPYLTASKWWNGSMGRTATHAVCMIVCSWPKFLHHARMEGLIGPGTFFLASNCFLL